MKRIVSLLLILSLVSFYFGFTPFQNTVEAAPDLKLVVDGVDITALSAPFIENDRTLVPIRFISEELDSEVAWDGEEYTVTITRGDRSIFLKIGSRLVEYDDGDSCIISDVAPKIINDRTYVPVRLVSNAFGIGISWDDATRTVSIRSDEVSTVEEFYDANLAGLSHGDVISGPTELGISISQELRDRADDMRIMLVDRGTMEGITIEKLSADTGSFKYSPSPSDNGKKILALALYDSKGGFVAGDAVSVDIDVTPEVTLKGAQRLDLVTDTRDLGVEANFPIYAAEYEITQINTGQTRNSGKKDPLSTYSWTPMLEENGICLVTATVYDKEGNAYSSMELPVITAVSRKLSMSGVTEGMTVDRPVNLIAARNFHVNETIYLIRDTATGQVSTLATVPYGSVEWFPGPDLAGEKQLAVRVLDTKGVYHQSDYVNVTVDGTPRILFKGLGPGQVLTSSTTLSVKSNINPEQVRYTLTDLDSGVSKYLDGAAESSGSVSYVPKGNDEGPMKVVAEAVYGGKTLTAPSVEFRVYLGTTYGPEPIVEKGDFLEFASEMAVESMKQTGMSAALQTAQAILETGWGQSVPVDKYTGKFSYNLFGIKGTGTNGSVISNTWEVYNGVSFRTDASFRAYNNVDEAWADHKRFLLDLSRYAAFRSVMHDCAEGAWALKRAGYATDPLYAIKLLDIINYYDLRSLDKEAL